jgi:hypothetical protein
MQPLKIKTAVLIFTFLSVAPLPIFLFFFFIVFGSESMSPLEIRNEVHSLGNQSSLCMNISYHVPYTEYLLTKRDV